MNIKRMLTVIMILAALGVSAGEPVGKVVGVQGMVVAATTAGEPQQLKLNSAVSQNDKIQTGPGAKVQIMFTDGTLFAQGENSEAVLTEYIYSPDRKDHNGIGFKLGLGIFRVITGKIADLNPERFRVKTGRATIGIRGCELAFALTEKKDRILLIRVPEGKEIILDGIRNRGIETGPVITEEIVGSDQGVGYTLEDNRKPTRSAITAEELLEIFRATTPDDAIPPDELIEGESDADEGAGDGEDDSGESDADGSETGEDGDASMGGVGAVNSPTEYNTLPGDANMTGFNEGSAYDQGIGLQGDGGVDVGPSVSLPGSNIHDGTYDPTATDPVINDSALGGEPGTTAPVTATGTDSGGSTTPEDSSGSSPTPLTIKGGGIGGLYVADIPGNKLTDIWMYKDLVGTMDAGVFNGTLYGQHDNFADGLPADDVERILSFNLTDFAPGSTAYQGYQEHPVGGVSLANDNLLQFWRSIDTSDNQLTLSYGGYAAENYPTSPGLPANSVIRYDIMFLEYPEHLPSTEPLMRVPEHGSLFVNMQTHDFWIDPSSSPALHGNVDWLQFFGQEWQGVGHIGGNMAPVSGNTGGGMGVAGFLDTTASAVQPADTGVVVHNGGYSVGVGFSDMPPVGVPLTHSFYSGEGNVSVIVNKDTVDNNAIAHIGVFQNPGAPTPQDIVMSSPNESYYVMEGRYEGQSHSAGQNTLIRGDVDTGTDWGWGEWNGEREVDYGGGTQTENIEGRYVTGRTITAADFMHILSSVNPIDLSGSGTAGGYIGNDNYRSRVDGSAYIHIFIPGGGGSASWDGSFDLNNANGDSLQVSYSPLSQSISSGGNLESSSAPDSYTLNTGGFTVVSPLVEHTMDGSLVGPGIGATPITGAIGSGSFRHTDGHFSEFTYGTDLH